MNLRVVTVVALLLLSACGQKGPLYLPGPTSTILPAAAAGEPEPAQAETEAEAETEDSQARKDKKD